MSIATRTGDDGTTSLRKGGRVKKTHPRVKAYGTIDELSSAIGIARAHANQFQKEFLLEIQKHLHLLAADLATLQKEESTFLNKSHLKMLDDKIIYLEKVLPKINHFVYSGDTPYSSYLHLARTICRRTECNILEICDHNDTIDPLILKYINRLSDVLWLIAIESSNSD